MIPLLHLQLPILVFVKLYDAGVVHMQLHCVDLELQSHHRCIMCAGSQRSEGRMSHLPTTHSCGPVLLHHPLRWRPDPHRCQLCILMPTRDWHHRRTKTDHRNHIQLFLPNPHGPGKMFCSPLWDTYHATSNVLGNSTKHQVYITWTVPYTLNSATNVVWPAYSHYDGLQGCGQVTPTIRPNANLTIPHLFCMRIPSRFRCSC